MERCGPISYHSLWPMVDRDWPLRRHGGSRRIRKFAQQVERVCIMFLSPLLFLFFRLVGRIRVYKDNDATVVQSVRRVCRADYHVAAAGTGKGLALINSDLFINDQLTYRLAGLLILSEDNKELERIGRYHTYDHGILKMSAGAI